ncbi:MAG TPA: ABC transporter ATP-binding protein [Candidatus Dormibacteraeota bacterium]|nr:ABC transporter ATP-binding protein [Candidatus Dormibacteraeota bacterium]
MLEVDSLRVAYGGVTALDGVSLRVADRGITAVLGPNGAGKSTLLRSIAGVVHPSAGGVSYNGRSLIGLRPEEIVRAGVSLVPEGGGSIRELTVEENLKLAHLWRRDPADRSKAMDMVMQLFPPLAVRRHLPAHSLSGGERQMLAVGRALMSRATLLLLDEPSLGLAPKLVTLIMRTVHDLAQGGLSVLLVEQNARSALSIADEAVLLSSGRTVAARHAGELARDEELWHAYLGY